jgi:uncharacterized protein YutD
MKLEEIGFYSLSDQRAKEASCTSQMKRCEMIITEECNFKCPYCRGFKFLQFDSDISISSIDSYEDTCSNRHDSDIDWVFIVDKINESIKKDTK